MATHPPKIGYHASHEQFPPSTLLQYAIQAEAAGFNAGSCSDHLYPWSERQGHSGFAWSWLGAAMHATDCSWGVVNAPGYRYHPVIIAQAAATLAEMHPGRFWLAAGSGEALNEHVTGERWPFKAERNARLKECIDVMRALWAGETVTHHGLVTVDDARVYSLPAEPPLVVGAAVSPETARWFGPLADGLLTLTQPKLRHREVIRAFRENGGEGKRVCLQIKVSYARTDAEALQAAWEQWRTNVFPSSVAADLRTVEQFDAIARFVRPEDLHDAIRISSDPARHAAWVQEELEAGADEVYIHNVGLGQEAFIEAYGRHVVSQVLQAEAS